jgi:hypothetical protein
MTDDGHRTKLRRPDRRTPRPGRGAPAPLAVVVIIAALLGAPGGRVRGAQPPPSEYKVKAELLRRFLDYVDWPDGTFPDPDAPVVVGVLGGDPFGTALDEAFHDQRTHNRPVLVRRSKVIDDLKRCQVLFVCRSERNRLSEILAGVEDLPVVTVSDINGFCRRGGILNFYIEDDKVRFAANAAAAQQKGIKLGSELLKRARLIGPEPERRKG